MHEVTIPEDVKRFASSFMNDDDQHITYHGMAGEDAIFSVSFNEDLDVGFPVLIVKRGTKIKKVEGSDTLDYLSLINLE